MSTCLVAQSGGPTAVINASLAGVIRANQLNPLYDRVLGGIHGIEVDALLRALRHIQAGNVLSIEPFAKYQKHLPPVHQ